MKRDNRNIIIQTNEDPTYEDGGDSAFATGLMAFAGSKLDKGLMPFFIFENKLVRHPYQPLWQWPSKTSRDQVIAFFAGMSSITSVDMKLSDYLILERSCLDYAQGWWVNNDFLMPDVRLYLYKCARQEAPLDLKLIGYISAAISIMWDCFIVPDREMNQSICKYTVLGKNWIKFFKKNHPSLERNINEYFCGPIFRNKAEIAVALNKKISEVVS